MTSDSSRRVSIRTQVLVSIGGGVIIYLVARFIFHAPDAGTTAVAATLTLFIAIIVEYAWQKVRGLLRKR
jgi:cell division protein FtsW (lipid II flippase)